MDFVGGQTGDNRQGRIDFMMYDKIINIFEAEKPAKSPVVPMAISALTVGLFFHFFVKLYSNGSNLSAFSFWGLIFSLNFLGILGMIVAFWIKINLVNTLWILLFLSPITLFTMNKGLTADNCHISGFYSKPKKD
jgi:hypothetical protein